MSTTLGLAILLAVAPIGQEQTDKPTNKLTKAEYDKVQAVIDDVEKACLDRTVYMLGRKKAQRLAELVRKAKPRLVVECGTAVGYSGLWIARELKAAGGGKLITIEISPERVKEAEANFRRAGLDDLITVKLGDARKVVEKIDGPIDFAFIDCGASNYHPILLKIEDKLRPGATVVADNAGISAGGMDDYTKHVKSKYTSRTEWFDLDLPWAERDAMEVTVIPGKKAESGGTERSSPNKK